MSYIDKLKRLLPSELLAVSQTSPPAIKELCWNYSDVKKVVVFLRENHQIILGGDIYIIKENQLDSTWDYWNYDIEEGISQQENVDRAYKMAMEYIEFFNNKLGNGIYFSIVIKTQN